MTESIEARRRSLLLGATAGAAGLLLPTWARAQDFPARPITFICPWPAGGTADASMRAICQVAARVLKQPIAVENRAGAAGMIGAKAIASAKPDGYTIGQIPISVTRFSQLGSLQADPRRDFTYIARTSGQTFGIAVLPDSKFKTLKDMVAHAKANPGRVTYAHAGVGGATHVGMEEFALAAGIQLNAIAYKGGAAALPL
jgi:tripartite-type tricarboxylate transporter receptor subunit TctC